MTIEHVTEDLVTAFVETFNAHDFDGLNELLADGAEIRGIVEEADTPVGVLEQFRLRSPWLSLARAELGLDPVAAMWVPDQNERYVVVGFMSFEAAGNQIARIELVDTVPGDLLSENPSPAWVTTEVDTVDGSIPPGPADHILD